MEFVWRILVYVGVMVSLFAIYYLVMRLLHSRNLARYDNYDRQLSKQDISYLEQAVLDLEDAANIKTPKWYKVLLYAGFVPTMFLCWAFLAGSVWGFERLFQSTRTIPEDTIYQSGGNLAGAYGPALFGGIFLAAVTLYAFSIKIPRLSNYVALNSDIHGFDKDSVRAGLLSKLEHKIRSRQHYSTSKFDAEKFLKSVNKSYRDGCLKWFYGCVIVAVILAFFDLRSETSFYSDRVVSSGAYLSVEPKQTADYKDITSVALECYFSDNKPHGYYYVFLGDEKLAQVRLGSDNLKEIAQVDDVLRGYGDIVFEPYFNKKGRNRLSTTCIGRLGKKLEQPHLVLRILSLDE